MKSIHTTRPSRAMEPVLQCCDDAPADLVTKREFRAIMEQGVELSRSTGSTVALIRLHVDNARLIEETLGRVVGDLLLLQVATVCRKLLGPGAGAASLDSRVISLFLWDLRQESNAVHLATDIVQQLQKPIVIGEHQFYPQASVGLVFGDGDSHLPTLVREADAAMRQCVGSRSRQIVIFTPAMRADAAERRILVADLHRAVKQREFVPYFQPIVDTRTGQVVSLEMLCRWQHPTLGTLQAGAFIEAAEETGLIQAISEQTIPTALRKLAPWRVDHPHLTLNLNIAGLMLRRKDQTDQLLLYLQTLGVPPSALRLEITERTLVDSTKATELMGVLSSAGMGISFDDFGTGYSNLQYLVQFPADNVKIDRRFVAHIDSDPTAAAIVRAVVDLGHSLGMTITAEGIESVEQLARVRELGCDHAQGYLLARPMPAADVLPILGQPMRW